MEDFSAGLNLFTVYSAKWQVVSRAGLPVGFSGLSLSHRKQSCSYRDFETQISGAEIEECLTSYFLFVWPLTCLMFLSGRVRRGPTQISLSCFIKQCFLWDSGRIDYQWFFHCTYDSKDRTKYNLEVKRWVLDYLLLPFSVTHSFLFFSPPQWEWTSILRLRGGEGELLHYSPLLLFNFNLCF